MTKFTTDDLVAHLRQAVQVKNEGADVEDEGLLAMSDEDLLKHIQVAAARDYSEYPVNKLPPNAVYPVLMIARRDLYWTLATIAAPLYRLGADGAYLNEEQRFEHYLELIKQLDKEYEDYLSNGGGSSSDNRDDEVTMGTLSSVNVQIANRYSTRYNLRTAAPPAVLLYIDSVGADYVELSWKPKRAITDFRDFRIYLCTTGEVFDLYQVKDADKIAKDAECVKVIKNIWQKKCRIEGLEDGKTYSVGIVVTANGGKHGYDSENFTAGEQEESDNEELESGSGESGEGGGE